MPGGHRTRSAWPPCLSSPPAARRGAGVTRASWPLLPAGVKRRKIGSARRRRRRGGSSSSRSTCGGSSSRSWRSRAWGNPSPGPGSRGPSPCTGRSPAAIRGPRAPLHVSARRGALPLRGPEPLELSRGREAGLQGALPFHRREGWD